MLMVPADSEMVWDDWVTTCRADSLVGFSLVSSTARVGPSVPRQDRPVREGTRVASIETGLAAAAAKLSQQVRRQKGSCKRKSLLCELRLTSRYYSHSLCVETARQESGSKFLSRYRGAHDPYPR